MSFSSEQKNKVITDQYKNSCCRKALLGGILFAKGSARGANVTVSLEKKEYCEFCAKLVYEFYGKDCIISSDSSGGRRKILSFESKAASKYISSLNSTFQPFMEKCAACSSSFLKGVFLACGSISDPEKQYLMEFSPANNADTLASFLREHSFFPRTAIRNEKSVLYIKRASEIEDLCGFLGFTDAMFEITNTQIRRDFLNNTNRVVNCETNNIEKSVSASGKQIEAINALIEHNLLSSLPDELEYTARLRIQNDSLSLSQLSKLFTPPISKSGLSHRLSKIIEISEQLLSEKN